MPEIGAGSFRQLPPAPKPAAKPAASLTTANNPRGVAIVQPKVVTPPKALTTNNNPRGVAIVQPQTPPTPGDVAATHPDPAATIKVFRAQPVAQQKAVVQGALKNPTVPVSKIILSYLKGPGAMQLPAVSGTLPSTNLFSAATHGLGHLLNPANIYGDGKAGKGAPAPEYGAVMFGGEKGAKTLLANTAKDAVNLPAETISTVGTIGGDALSGNIPKAVSDFVNPFVQTAEHLPQAFYAHPLNTTLMASGLLGGASRLAAAPIRALAPESALGRVVGTEREGVALTGNLTHERPPYSKAPSIKAGQVAAEKVAYERAPTGELVPKSEGLRVKLLKKGVGELVGVQERIRRVNRALTQAAREKAITPGLATRAAKGAKTALAYGPQKAVIPGADVLARIADATVRRPDTIAEDITKHVQQVAATRPELLDEPKALKAHDAYVKQMTNALNNKSFLKNPGPAFKAAETYRTDYVPVQAEAHALGHFGSMDAGGLQRRDLMHYAVTHMGATMKEDPVKVAAYEKLVQDLPKQHPDWTFGQKQAALTRARPDTQLLDATGKPLSNAAIIKHLNGPEGTGGRMPAYTPDRPRFDPEKEARKTNFVSQARRPLPMTKKNTLYAYTHGLTEPGHSALTEQHVLMQGVVDSHRAQNAYLDTLVTQKPGGGYWDSHPAAQHDAPNGYVPINLAQPFHPQASLDQALQGTAPATIEEEAVRRSLDLSSRLQDSGPGRYGIIDERALQALKAHENQISPNVALRTIRSLNNQFRTVALATSPKHVPGVAQEDLIRLIANGAGVRSWITGGRLMSRAEELNPRLGANARTTLTGGQLVGMTEAGKTYTVSDHWVGTNIHPVLKGMEAFFKTPGPRQLRTAWRGWTNFALGTTKHLLEQQTQKAFVGKAALMEHGYAEAARVNGFMGLAQRAMGLHGQMLDDAAKGLFDPAKLRQFRAVVNRMGGKWTDLSPSGQTGLMISPFGLWWVNSAKFLARMPIDQPVKTGLLAAATTGTQQERQAKGLDMFSPGHLPLYMQGGIPMGGKVLAQNYYSPFGVVNNPLETAAGLLEPWASPPVNAAAFGIDWLGKPLTAAGQNTNRGNEKSPSVSQIAQYIIDSGMASFIPLYTKAEQLTEGGGSPYDVTGNSVLPPLLRGKAPATKTAGGGLLAGLKKATLPVREYRVASSSSGATGWGGSLDGAVMPGSGSVDGAVMPGGGGTSSSSSSGWGGGSSTSGWGG